MTAAQFADATWFVAALCLMFAGFTSDLRVFKWCMSIVALWFVVVAAMAMATL